MTDSSSCGICITDYKGKRIAKVTCQYCPFHACKGCHQAYLLQTYEDPHCMDCKRGWSSDFLATIFPLSFRTGPLRQHRRKILYEREKAILPSMQVFVQAKREMNRLDKESRQFYNSDQMTQMKTNLTTAEENAKIIVADWVRAKEARKTLYAKQWDDPSSVTDEEVDSAMVNVAVHFRAAKFAYQREKVAKRDYMKMARTIQTLRDEWYRQKQIFEGRGTSPGGTRAEFLMKCGEEGCRGFLSTAYKCGTCANWTCPDCLVVLGPDKEVAHTCEPGLVETAKAIKQDTRPCPKCGTRIFKIDGCDQMWCVMENCNTAFSWNSGHIVTGTVHNPHYYEWLRRNPASGGAAGAQREIGDIPCGGLPGFRHVVHVLGLNNAAEIEVPEPILTGFFRSHRNITELIELHLPGFPGRPPHGMNKVADVAYLMNELDEAAWKRALEITEHRFMRKKEIGQILHMVATTASDQIREMLLLASSSDGDPVSFQTWFTTTFLPELEALRAYTNEALRNLSIQERTAVPQLGDDFKWIPLRALYKPPIASKEAGASTTQDQQQEAPEAPVPMQESPSLSLQE